MLRGRVGVLANLGNKPTARSYVQDGLVAMWDCIENVGWGMYDASATVWKDLVRPDVSLDVTNFEFVENTLKFKGRGLADKNALPTFASTKWTVEAGVGGGVVSIADSFEYGGVFSMVSNRIRILVRPSDMRLTCYLGSVFEYPIGYTLPSDLRTVTMRRHDSAYSSYCDSLAVRETSSTVDIQFNQKTLYLGTLGGSYSFSEDSDVRIGFLRIYNRALAAEEIAHNYKVDKVRFGL